MDNQDNASTKLTKFLEENNIALNFKGYSMLYDSAGVLKQVTPVIDVTEKETAATPSTTQDGQSTTTESV